MVLPATVVHVLSEAAVSAIAPAHSSSAFLIHKVPDVFPEVPFVRTILTRYWVPETVAKVTDSVVRALPKLLAQAKWVVEAHVSYTKIATSLPEVVGV